VKYDILLCGVGGQGILSVAYVMDQSAMEAGYFLKQPEVHGMSQRGGAVQAHVRVSNAPIASDLIPAGEADLILSLEPLESLRYLRSLNPETGRLVTDITPFANIPDYPALDGVIGALLRVPSALLVNGAHLARKAGSPKAQNMVVLGAAVGVLPYAPEILEKHIAEVFARKSDRLVHINLNAFRMGRALGEFQHALVKAGVAPALTARLTPWLDFQPWSVPEPALGAWADFLAHPKAGQALDTIWAAAKPLPVDEETPRSLLN
jgi:indolepyruvate ferredoxin oxidoreductase beta subunit